MSQRFVTLEYLSADRDVAHIVLHRQAERNSSPRIWVGEHEVARNDVDAELKSLRRAIRRVVSGRGETLALEQAGQSLFDLLLPEEVKAELRRYEGTLSIICDEDLPWPLLHTGATFLGLGWALGQLLTEGMPSELPKPNSEPGRMLVVADPATDLPAARAEGESLFARVRDESEQMGVDLRLGRMRTNEFLRLFRGASIVHFAGHADPSQDGDGGWRFVDGHVGPNDWLRLKGGGLPRLVFGNACSSALDGGRGALLRAGVEHFVGTTVDVPDVAGGDFAGHFYRALLKGEPIGHALKNASIHEYAQGGIVWAAYRLFGAPDVVYFPRRKLSAEAPGLRTAAVLAVRIGGLQGVGPEEMAERFEDGRRVVREVVAQARGRILAGRSGVVRAVFGVPFRHSDDLNRAASAAAEVVRRLSTSVAVFELGTVMTQGVEVVGPPTLDVEKACWMNPAGAYGLSEAKRRLGNQATWVCEAKAGWRLKDVTEEPEALEGTLVGRDRELSALEASFEQSREQGRFVFATVVGGEGLGKTRLLREAALRLSIDKVIWAVGHGARTPAPSPMVASVVMQVLGVGKDVDRPKLRKQVESRLSAMMDELGGGSMDILSIDALLSEGPEEFESTPDPSAIMALLGYGEPGHNFEHDLLINAFQSLLRGAAQTEPIVIFIDDFGHAQPFGRQVFNALVDEGGEGSVTFVFAGHADDFGGNPNWFGARGNSRIELAPLSKTHGETLLRELLVESDVDALASMNSRAEGNPLFLRELALAWNEGETGAPPPSVEAVIQGRVDQLEHHQRELLRAASIFGRDFYEDSLAALTGHSGAEAELLRVLERKGLVQQRSTEGSSNVQWRLCHALLQEVVYGNIPSRTRRALHGRAAVWFEHRLESLGVVGWRDVAHHQDAAEDFARSATAWLKAGEAAAKAFANDEAMSAFIKARNAHLASGALNSSEEGKVLIGLGRLELASGRLQAALAWGDEAVALGTSALPLEKAYRLQFRADVQESLGDIDAARETLAEALAVLGDDWSTEERLVAMDLQRYSGWLLYRQHRFEDARLILEGLLEELPEDVSCELKGLVLNVLGVVAYGQGRYEDAAHLFESALALFEILEDHKRMCSCFNNLGMVQSKLGEWSRSAEWYQRAVKLHVRRGDRNALAQTYNNLGSLYGEMGALEKAEKFLTESIRIRSRSGHGGLALGYANLGEVLLKKGDSVGAKHYLNEAMQLCDEGRGPAYLRPDLCRALAELHLADGAHREAKMLADRGLSLALEAGDRPREAHARKVLGEILAILGDHSAADESFKQSGALFSLLEQPLMCAEVAKLRDANLGRDAGSSGEDRS